MLAGWCGCRAKPTSRFGKEGRAKNRGLEGVVGSVGGFVELSITGGVQRERARRGVMSWRSRTG